MQPVHGALVKCEGGQGWIGEKKGRIQGCSERTRPLADPGWQGWEVEVGDPALVQWGILGILGILGRG